MRLRVRPSLRLEMLEPRCLMSIWTADLSSADDRTPSDRSADARSQPSEVQPLNPGGRQGSNGGDSYSESAQGPRAQSVIVGNTGSADPWLASPDDQAPDQVPYVVVPETSASHRTIQTAQKLPDLSYFGVVGTIGNRDEMDLYQLTLSTGAGRLDFSLASTQSGSGETLQFELFDGSGRALGVWTSGSQAATDLHAQLSNLPAGTTLYLGVSAGKASDAGLPGSSVGYQLWIEHDPGLGRDSGETTGLTTVSGTGIMPVTSSGISASSTPGNTPPGAEAQVNMGSAQNPEDGGRVAAGSASVRSARPSGGLLSEADPTPPAARNFNATVNKEWDERPTSEVTSRAGNASPPELIATRQDAPDPLVVVQGPGGFPLLGAVAIGHRRRSPAAELNDVAISHAIKESGPQLEAPILASVPVHSVDNRGVEAPDATFFEALSARDLTEYPVSVYSGLGLATIFTLNAVFSQPMAGFDYLPSRLDTDARSQSDWKDRRRKRATGL
jgi:hypothetical protein